MTYALPQNSPYPVNPSIYNPYGLFPVNKEEVEKKMDRSAPVNASGAVAVRVPLSERMLQQLSATKQNKPSAEKQPIHSTGVLGTNKNVVQNDVNKLPTQLVVNKRSIAPVNDENENSKQKKTRLEQDVKEQAVLYPIPKEFTLNADQSLSLEDESLLITMQQFQTAMHHFSQRLKSDSKENLLTTGEVLKVGDVEFYAKVQDGRLAVFRIIELLSIADETNANVHKVVDCVAGTFAALKLAPKIIPKMQNGIAIVKYIHSNGLKPGIELPIEAEFNIPNVFGFTRPYYYCDLSEHMDNDQMRYSQILNYVNQLLQMVKTLRDVGVWHGNINPDNVWLAEDNKLLLGHFDCSSKFEDVERNFIHRPFNSLVSEADERICLQAINEKNFIKIKEAALAMDYYAISCCIFEVIFGIPPYDSKESTIRSSQALSSPRESPWNSAVTIFVTEMVNHDPAKRPSLEQAIKFWHGLDENSALKKDINPIFIESTDINRKESDSQLRVINPSEQAQQKTSHAEIDFKTMLSLPSVLNKFTIDNGKVYLEETEVCSKSQLEKVILQFNKRILSSKESLSKHGEAIEDFYVKLQNNKPIIITFQKKLGKGIRGEVYKIIEFVSGIFAAFKYASSDDTTPHIKNEVAILKYIHASGVKPGIQPVPTIEFDSPNTLPEAELESNALMGFSSPLYESDLHEYLVNNNDELTFAQKINFIGQILQALKVLRDVGVWHGDIQLTNIWVENADKLLIGDFDGAVIIAKVMEHLHTQLIDPETLSPWRKHEDLESLNQAYKLKDAEKIKEIALAMDLHAASNCIFEIIMGNHPYKIEDKIENSYLCPDAKIQFPASHSYSLTVTIFLERMFDNDRTKRPSIDQMIKFWSELDESIAIPPVLNHRRSKSF